MSYMDGPRFEVRADASFSGAPIELHSVEKQKGLFALASGDDLLDVAKATLVEARSTLPMFAEIYNISADIKDYLMVPVVIMPTELPNRNGVGFPFDQLIAANAELGCLGFQTWTNKPTFADHNNKDHTKAKGIIMSSTMRPIKNSKGDVHKIICLCTYDRSRDPILANSILTGDRKSYSMGAWTGGFKCSRCNAMHSGSPGCEHISIQRPVMSTYTGNDGKRQLTYLRAQTPVGFECSSVVVPAYFSATTDKIMRWDDPQS